MLKKELNEILKQSLYFIIFFICLPLLFMAGSRIVGSSVSYLQFFFPLFQVSLLIFALIAGISLFTSERKQDGIEYLLTLPLSRLKLLAIKIFPRLAAIIVFSLLYVLLVKLLTSGAESMQLTYTLPANIFFFMLCSLFIIAVSLSASHHNFLVIALLGLVVFCIYGMLVYFFTRTSWLEFIIGPIDYSTTGLLFIFILILPLPLLFSFIFSFKKFDVGPEKSFNKSYLKFFIPFLIAGLVLSSIYLYSVRQPFFNNYYITREHKLIEQTYSESRIYDGEGAHKIDELRFPTIILEHGDYIYTDMLFYKRKIFRTNKKNYRTDTFYSSPVSLRTRYFLNKFEDTLAFIALHSQFKEYVLITVHLETQAVKEIKLKGLTSSGFGSPWLIGADEIDGNRFWLIYAGKIRQHHVSRVWENGRIDRLAETNTGAAYFNHMLVTTDDEGMLFSKITGEGLEIVKRLPQGSQVTPLTFYMRKILDNEPVKEMYGRVAVDGRVFRIDLETFAANWIDTDSSYIRYFSPDCYFSVEIGLDEKTNRHYMKTISMLKDGKLELLKEFGPEKAYTDFLVSKWGFDVEIDGKIKVYTLPECKELTFKGLN